MKKFFIGLFLIGGIAIAANAQTRRAATTATPAGRTATARTDARTAVAPTGRTATARTAGRAATTTSRAGVGRAGVTSTSPRVATTTTTTTTTSTDTSAVVPIKSLLQATQAQQSMTAAQLVAQFEEEMQKVDARLGIQSQCQERFAECMDTACKDGTYGRCLCSSGYSQLSPIIKEIENLTKEINALSTEELARAKMSEAERAFYDKQTISLNVTEEEPFQYGPVSMESLMAGYYDGTSTSTANLTGDALFKETQKACQPILDACPAERNAVLAYYNNLATRECQSAKNSLEQKRSETQFARQQAEFNVKQATYTTIAKKLDNATCLANLKDLAVADSVCGKDYGKCLG
ncbi:MAG: hypothetical protein LBR35_02190, partial [Rickettsiales bacterium]|nr:hypothetical protein [Rickettsiales bacterium]